MHHRTWSSGLSGILDAVAVGVLPDIVADAHAGVGHGHVLEDHGVFLAVGVVTEDTERHAIGGDAVAAVVEVPVGIGSICRHVAVAHEQVGDAGVEGGGRVPYHSKTAAGTAAVDGAKNAAGVADSTHDAAQAVLWQDAGQVCARAGLGVIDERCGHAGEALAGGDVTPAGADAAGGDGTASEADHRGVVASRRAAAEHLAGAGAVDDEDLGAVGGGIQHLHDAGDGGPGVGADFPEAAL